MERKQGTLQTYGLLILAILYILCFMIGFLTAHFTRRLEVPSELKSFSE